MIINYNKTFENNFVKEYEGYINGSTKHSFKYFKNNNRIVFLGNENGWKNISQERIGIDIAELIDYMEENKC